MHKMLKPIIMLNRYAVDVVITEKQAYQERVSQWCIAVPPRCSKFQIRFRTVNKTQTLKKNRIVRECCGMSFYNYNYGPNTHSNKYILILN